MKIDESQIRGLIVISLVLAVAPFFIFFLNRFYHYETPLLTTQHSDSVLIEVAGGSLSGIYFVPFPTDIHTFFKWIHLGKNFQGDVLLRTGMKVIIADQSTSHAVKIDEMDVASKLALGLPVNVNQASAEDLMMIRGIGKKTADSIVALRAQKGRIKCLEQLMEIKGIKEKKLQALKKYLYAG